MDYNCYFIKLFIKIHILEGNKKFLLVPKFFLAKNSQKWAIIFMKFIFWEKERFGKMLKYTMKSSSNLSKKYTKLQPKGCSTM